MIPNQLYLSTHLERLRMSRGGLELSTLLLALDVLDLRDLSLIVLMKLSSVDLPNSVAVDILPRFFSGFLFNDVVSIELAFLEFSDALFDLVLVAGDPSELVVFKESEVVVDFLGVLLLMQNAQVFKGLEDLGVLAALLAPALPGVFLPSTLIDAAVSVVGLEVPLAGAGEFIVIEVAFIDVNAI